MPNYTQTYLDELEQAYSALIKGEAVREVTDSDGTKLVYSAMNRRDLLRHIQEVRRSLDSGSETRGPLGFTF